MSADASARTDVAIKFWGAAQTVTGSLHLLQIGGKHLILDCGLAQGRRKEAYERNREFPIKPSEVDAVVLSHAHIDHSGNLPTLVKGGFRGPIFATSATRDLAVFLLLDSAEIQTADVEYANRARRKAGKHLFEPLYQSSDAMDAIRLFRTIDYHQPFEPISGVRCRFWDAGHMLGSAMVSLDIDRGENERPTRLVFSGDLGRHEIPILRAPETIDGTDFLIMESTYGDRIHESSTDATQMLKEIVEQVVADRGKLIIPAFSVGRTQEIVYRLNDLAESGLLPKVPVFVDSPLAVNATTVFKSHPECFDDESFERILTESDQDPLGFEHLFYVHKKQDSQAINNLDGPAVIISSSGMCEGGRVVHHLKHQIEKPNTVVLFAGFQAPQTLGRKILDGNPIVSIQGRDCKVRAKIAKLESTSGHADQRELCTWAQSLAESGEIQRVMLVHGEPDAADALRTKLLGTGIPEVLRPERGEIVSLE